MMIISRYLTKQILQVTAATTFILLAVVVLGRFLKYLAQASQGEIDPAVLALLMSYRIPEFIQLILPLALLLSILLAYGRMYAENEMTVLSACGLSTRRLLGITLISSTLVAVTVGLFSFTLTPWGLVNTAGLLEAQKELNEFDVMVPGLFQNISQGERTTYTEEIINDEMQNVFMYESDSGQVTVANTAVPSEDEEGRRFVLFSEGSVSESEIGVVGNEGFLLTQFSEMGVRIPNREISIDVTVEEKAMATAALWQSDESAHAAELQWRISLVLLIPVLTLMAVPLSRVSPRQGRFAKIVPAVFLYILYFGLLLVSRDMTAAGDLPLFIGLWWVHGVFLLLGWLLFTDRVPGFSQ
ncbi:MAG: LPS export ABC transporter permease LptF [Gammaproteobacteria bacterium]|nr:LPS export ABC transporter permease LptF [Gammaproteobacteria bacterium]